MARILVVDDSSFQRMMVKNLLIAHGHEPILAENGQVGLERLQEHPDVVLCDLVMPVLDGFQFLETVASHERPVPTVVISADIQASARERCMQLGARGFLNKPVAEDQLLRTLAELIQGGAEA
ncbi:MAG: response regulator [Planctomycetes bacterium]|nr:response regulator [Planctomycetota bacterium]